MATLRIPKEHQGGFKKLVVLVDNDSVQELLSALREVPPVLYGSELSSKVASRVDTIPRSDIDDVMEVLLPLYILRARYESSAPDFVEDVCRAMDRSSDKGLRLSGEDRERFKDRLIELLDVESINLGVRAQEVLFEDEHSVDSEQRGWTWFYVDRTTIASEDLDKAADALAARLRITRSQLNSKALAAFIEEYESEELIEEINEAYDEEMEREDKEFAKRTKGYYRRLLSTED